MFCEKCGAQLEAGAKFCSVCGYTANNGQANNSNNTQQYDYNTGMNNTGYSNNGFANGGNNNNFANNGFNAQMQPSPMRKSKKAPILVGLLAVLAIVAVLTGLYFTVGKNMFATPTDRTIKAVTNLTKVKAVDVTTELKLKLEGASGENVLVKDIVEGMSIKVGGKYDQDKKQGAFDIALIYKKQAVVDLKAYVDEDVIVIESEELLEEPLYANIKDLEELAGEDFDGMSYGMPINMEDLAPYEEFVKGIQEDSQYKSVAKNYGDFFKEVLTEYIKKNGSVDVTVVEGGKEKTIKADELEVTINDAFIKKVVKGLLEKVVEDDELKALIKDKAQEFYDLAEENGDLEDMDLDEESFEEAMDDFDDSWDEAMDELEVALDEMDEELANLEFNSSAKFRIDSSNRLRQLTYEIEAGEILGEAMGMEGLSGSLIIETTYNAFDGDVEIEKLSTDGARNLAEMDEYEMMDMMGAITQKLQETIMSTFGGGF
jgi:tetratricopeptide (TPR) repeat protein